MWGGARRAVSGAWKKTVTFGAAENACAARAGRRNLCASQLYCERSCVLRGSAREGVVVVHLCIKAKRETRKGPSLRTVLT